MNKKLLGLVSGLTLLTSISQASPESDAMPVVMGSSCNYQVRAPENSMGYIFSGDCKTVFVLPATVGDLSVPAFQATAHTLLCGAVGEYQASQAQTAITLMKLDEQLRKAKSKSEIDLINSKLATIEKYRQVGLAIFNNKPAASAQLVFKNSVGQREIDQWAILNLELIRQHGINFKPAAIGKSILTFAVKPALELNEPAILSADIPGLELQENKSYKSLNFQGSLSGQVVFSLFGGCPLLNKVPKDMSETFNIKPSVQNIGANLVANQSFEVPVRSQMRYKATLRKSDTIDFLNNFVKEKGPTFKISQLVERHGTADIEDLVDLELYLSDLNPAQSQNWVSFKEKFYGDVLTRLSTRMVEELEKLQILQLTPYAPEDAPNAGVVNVPGIQRVCSSSRVFGIKVSSSCGDRMVNIPTMVAGRSSLVDNQSLGLDIHIHEEMVVNELTTYDFTSTFAPAQK